MGHSGHHILPLRRTALLAGVLVITPDVFVHTVGGSGDLVMTKESLSLLHTQCGHPWFAMEPK